MKIIKKMKTVCVSLTNRTNYSKLKLVLKELNKYKNLEIKIVISSTILLNRYGDGYKDLINDGWQIDKKIDCILMNDSHEAMSKTIGISIIEHSSYFAEIKPDILLIVGDRFDMLAPALTASMMNIPIGHIQGGELSGTIDNVIRDIISRISCMHFVSTSKSAENLRNYGIDNNLIFNYGCPAVEYISMIEVGNHFDENKINKKFKSSFNIDKNEEYLLVMIHPDTTNNKDVNTELILQKIEKTKMKAIIFYPNVDPNNSIILSSISNYKNNENFHIIKHMPLEGFIHVMSKCSCMITNSSSGIREAASFGVPVLNLGYRQVNRERNLNVIDIGNNYKSIEKMIYKYKNKKFPIQNIYYKKNCSKRIAEEILNKINLS